MIKYDLAINGLPADSSQISVALAESEHVSSGSETLLTGESWFHTTTPPGG